WMEDVGTDDDEVPDDKVSQELLEEMSGEIDEAKLQKAVDEMKAGNKGPKKYILSLHKYPAVPFSDDDIEERTSRWNIRGKKDHIRSQKHVKDNPHEVYSESKIVEIIRTTYELGHKHKFITEIIVRRANRKIHPITEPDYKYLNKNDIEDMYLLCINDKVKDYRETGLLESLLPAKFNLTALTITFPGIKKEELFTITSEPVVGVLKGLEKHSKDVKYGYVDPSPSDADVEYLQFYEEDIRECLKHRDHMRRWEMYVNGRPLGSRRDHLV
ncbi:hypothetical protein Tco_0190837, partial [Tanacetum coccineum]